MDQRIRRDHMRKERRRTYVCHKGWNLQTISTMHPKKGIIPLLLRKIQTPPLFSSLNEHHHLSLQKQRNGEKQGGLFYLEMMTAEQLNWLCLFPSPPSLRKKPNSHNFRYMSKSAAISLIDWKIKKVGLDQVNYF